MRQPEELYELDQEQNFDLLVLDTPPSRNALDFLYAPRRVTAFLEGRALPIATMVSPLPELVGLPARGESAQLALQVPERFEPVSGQRALSG